jgi:2-polyprenyl-3-methyl-5-hydroxy-6-metoxy-1,4-benzoquinol methylase
MTASDDVLQEQIAYYRARASEYDEWFLRRGRFDYGPELNRQWFAEVVEVAQALTDFNPAGHVLELACGTGWWTQQLAGYADRITAVDASPEVIEINRKRLSDPRVEYVQADLFTWKPQERYDVVFFSFWLSHVPQERFESFWETVRSALAPGGRVFFIDSLYSETSSAKNHSLNPEEATMRRKLNDGREFQIYKLYYDPNDLEMRLSRMGWNIAVHATANYFLYGRD